MAIVVIIISGVALLLAVACAILYRKTESRRDELGLLNEKYVTASTECAKLTESLNNANADNGRLLAQSQELSGKLLSLSTENSRLAERLAIISGDRERTRKENELQFKQIAADILDNTSLKNDARMSEMLKPLRTEIERLNKEINDRAVEDGKNSAALKEQIAMLAQLNRQVSSDTNALTQTLKGTGKLQGDWGEMILEQILETSGLVKGQHFDVQVTRDSTGRTITNDSDNSLRPDVVVYFPDKKKIIIDSKVSLSSYINFINAEDRHAQKEALNAHVAAVKRNVDKLASKSYQSFLQEAGDFVFMFIPNEGAYIAAMQADSSLWEYAYRKHVVVVCPTHLLSVLKLVGQLWRHDSQTKNAIAIADASGKLYDKFAGFVADMESISRAINSAAKAHDDAMKKLSSGRGNLISSVEKLKELGAKATKQLPASDEA